MANANSTARTNTCRQQTTQDTGESRLPTDSEFRMLVSELNQAQQRQLLELCRILTSTPKRQHKKLVAQWRLANGIMDVSPC
jgi:hypothetical protein